MELFSVTVMGGSGCGKTSLINSFVSNSCPTVPEETQSAQLYYKTLSVTSKGATAPQPVLVEIEDTYGPGQAGGQRSIETFLSVDRALHADSEAVELLQGYEFPEVDEYRPLCPRRMAFLLVFDCNSEVSLAEAKELHAGLLRGDNVLSPVVYLVANKVDVDPTGEKRRAAQRYAKEKDIAFFELSAYDLRKVKQLFRSVLADVLGNADLWRHQQKRRQAFSRMEDIDKFEFDNEDSREAMKREEEELAQLQREAAKAADENKRRLSAKAESSRAAEVLAAEDDPAPMSVEASHPATPLPEQSHDAVAVQEEKPPMASGRTAFAEPVESPLDRAGGQKQQTESEDRFGFASLLQMPSDSWPSQLLPSFFASTEDAPGQLGQAGSGTPLTTQESPASVQPNDVPASVKAWTNAPASSAPPLPPPSEPPPDRGGGRQQTESEDRFGLVSWLMPSFYP